MPNTTPEEELKRLRDNEAELALIAEQNGEEYTMKSFEILEGEVQEVADDEGNLVRENPLDFPDSVQRKYFGVCAADWVDGVDWNRDDKNMEIPKGFFEAEQTVYNPYKKKYITHKILSPIPPLSLDAIKQGIISWEISEVQDSIPSKDIGEIIIEKNFDGNINGQLAALSKSNIKMLAVLAKVVGLPTIHAVFAEEIAMARAISDTRVLCGLSPFDLSFLD